MDFRELVTAPVGWFIVSGIFIVSTAVVFLVWLGPLEAVSVALGLAAVVALWISSLSYRIVVDRTGVRVGRSLLEWEYTGSVTALSVAETQELSGPKADARAWLRLPPFTHRAVRVDVQDDADPHPYWLVGTRRPEELAAAVSSRKAGDND